MFYKEPESLADDKSNDSSTDTSPVPSRSTTITSAVSAIKLEKDVQGLCALGPRSGYDSILSAQQWIYRRLTEEGIVPRLESVPTPCFRGPDETRYNLIYRQGANKRVLVLCAHYDTVPSTVGADDNASGVAVLLQLASVIHNRGLILPADIAVECAFLVNEEPPYCGSEHMGSYHYFNGSLPARGVPALVVNLDCLGFSRGGRNPAWVIRSKSDLVSRNLFAAWDSPVPLSTHLHEEAGLGSLSDLCWTIGRYPAVHLCDMAIYNNPYIHTSQDTPETLDYTWMSAVTGGLVGVLAGLCGISSG